MLCCTSFLIWPEVIHISYYGNNFVFDDQYSENYGLKILTLGSSSAEEIDAGANVEPFFGATLKKPTRYLYGISQNNVLSFDMQVISDAVIDGVRRSKISKWLFGRQNYCRMIIANPEIHDIFFNCFLLNPKGIYVGSHCHGFSFSVECDAPWAWQNEKTYRFMNSENAYTQRINHYNDSDNTDYTYPHLVITTGNTGGTITFQNNSDNGRQFSVANVKAKEIITVDNDRSIITSTSGLNLSENFNKKFFRMVSGKNELVISGDVTKFEMKYSNARKIGG